MKYFRDLLSALADLDYVCTLAIGRARAVMGRHDNFSRPLDCGAASCLNRAGNASRTPGLSARRLGQVVPAFGSNPVSYSGKKTGSLCSKKNPGSSEIRIVLISGALCAQLRSGGGCAHLAARRYGTEHGGSGRYRAREWSRLPCVLCSFLLSHNSAATSFRL